MLAGLFEAAVIVADVSDIVVNAGDSGDDDSKFLMVIHSCNKMSSI